MVIQGNKGKDRGTRWGYIRKEEGLDIRIGMLPL